MTKTFHVTLTAPKTDTPDAAVRRLRAFLKSALRGFGVKCVACRQIGPDAEPNAENALAGSPLTLDRASTGIGTPPEIDAVRRATACPTRRHLRMVTEATTD